MLQLLSRLKPILVLSCAAKLSTECNVSCATTWRYFSPFDLSTMISKYVFALT